MNVQQSLVLNYKPGLIVDMDSSMLEASKLSVLSITESENVLSSHEVSWSCASANLISRV